MVWETVYDLEQSGYTSWWASCLCLIFVFVGLLLAFGRFEEDTFNALIGCVRRPLGVLFALAGTAGLFLGLEYSYSEYVVLSTRLRTGHVRTIEGVVRDFRTLPKSDTFYVKDVHFSYGDNLGVNGNGYGTLWRGSGPIRNGVYVHIDYADDYAGGKILRLKIRKEQARK